jgi:hypothetical protein
MTWVTDLSHFIDAQTGQLPTNVPGSARRLMEQQTRIVAAATTAAVSHDHARDQITCRRRPGRRACPGIIKHRLWADERITWRCPRCGDNGVISNWQSTAWDRRSVRPVH